jgi:hypothetical protein
MPMHPPFTSSTKIDLTFFSPKFLDLFWVSILFLQICTCSWNLFFLFSNFGAFLHMFRCFPSANGGTFPGQFCLYMEANCYISGFDVAFYLMFGSDVKW